MDLSLVENHVDEMVYQKLPYHPPIMEPGDCWVIGGNGKFLDQNGFTVLSITLGTTLLWHEYGVVPNILLEVLIGADVLTNYLFTSLPERQPEDVDVTKRKHHRMRRVSN